MLPRILIFLWNIKKDIVCIIMALIPPVLILKKNFKVSLNSNYLKYTVNTVYLHTAVNRVYIKSH